MNSYPAQLSAALARLVDLLAGNLFAAGVVLALLLLAMIVASRRGEAARHGDDAALASAPRRLALPPSPSTPSPSTRATTEPAPADPRRALLVVDDSAVARAKLRRLFEAAGYRVELASDGVEALQLLPTVHFSVLVTDLEMPHMDGPELIASVVGSIDTENLPIVAITGHDELQARVHQVQGLYGIFRKPWNDRELLKRVEALASLRPPAGTHSAAPLARCA